MANGLPTDIASQIKTQEQQLLERGQRLGRFDKIRQREFYSSYLFPVGLGGQIPAGRYEVFTALKGDTGQGYGTGLTERETNWQAKRRVADNHNLLIKSYHCEIRRPPTDFSATGLQIYPASVLTGGALANPPAAGKVDPQVPLHPADVATVAYGAILGVTYLTNTVPLGFLADFPAVGGAEGWVSASRQFPSSATAGLSGTATGAGNRAQLPLARNSTVPAFERRAQVPTLLQHSETFSMVIIVPSALTLMSVPPTVGTNGENNDATGVIEVRISFWATESYVERS